MNSRERLLCALEGGTPDRVPVSTYELVGYNSRSFENQEPSYRRVMDAIREQSDCIAMWNPDSDEWFLSSSFKGEMDSESHREGNNVITKRTLHTPKGDLTQTFMVTDNIKTVWQVEHWCKSPEDIDKALSVPYEPVTFDASDYARIQAEVGDNGIIMASTGDALLLAMELMEFGDATVWAMTEEEHFERTVRTLHERYLENVKAMLEAQVVDLYRICGPEYSTPPYLPNRFFEKYVADLDRELVELIHSYGAKVRIHCHGKVGSVLDPIVATGADAIDPVEAPPDGDIELAEVKRRLQGKMCVFGNVQLKFLETLSTDRVRQIVKDCMDAAKAGGGFVLMPTAAPINIPLAPQTEANYLAYLEAAREYGAY